MSKPRHLRKQRRRLLPLLLLAVFVFAAVYAGAHCLFRQPEQKLAPAPARETSAGAEAVSSEAQGQEVLRSHLERKADFYTILVSGVDDGNGGSDTNILLAVDAVNNYIYGVSIPRDTKAVWGGKSHKITPHIIPAAWKCLPTWSPNSWGFPWITQSWWTCGALKPW